MFFKWLPKWWMQWHDVFDNTFYEIYAPQNIDIDRVNIESLRLLVSDIGLFLCKCPPFCLNGGYNGMMYPAIHFLKSTPQKTYKFTWFGMVYICAKFHAFTTKCTIHSILVT